MKYVVHKVEGSNRKEFGFGVFPAYQIGDRPTSIAVSIRSCSEIGDSRPLHVQGKALRLLGLYPSEPVANQEAKRLTLAGKLGYE